MGNGLKTSEKRGELVTKYVVVDMPKDGISGDWWQEVYDTAEEANAAAESQWEHLTDREQKRRHIYAGIVTEKMLPKEAVNEDTGVIDWSLFADHDTFPGAFDSEHCD